MENNKTRVLITGATGSIGKHLVRALIDEGYSCRCLVRETSNVSELSVLGVELFYGDICNVDSIKGIADGIDIVYHLAAEGHVSSSSNGAHNRFLKVNVEGTKNLIEECLKSKVKKFIHFSSTAAMGLIEDNIVDEDTLCMPQTPYQKAKYLSEQTVLDFWRKKQFPALILRPCMVYGEGCKGEYLRIFGFMKRGIFPRLGKGKKLTPIIYVANLIHAAVTTAEKGKPGNVYLLADESIEMDILRQKVLTYLEVKRFYFYVPPKVAILLISFYEKISHLLKIEPKVTVKNIKSTIADRIFNTNKARNELGLKQIVGLDESLHRTIVWAKGQGYLC